MFRGNSSACAGPPLSGLVASKKPTALPTRKPRHHRNPTKTCPPPSHFPQNLIFTFIHLPLLTSLANHPLSSLAAAPLTPGCLGQAAAAAESEEQTLAELLEAEGLAAEPEQEVMAGYTLFEVEQDNIRHAPTASANLRQTPKFPDCSSRS